MSRGIQRRCTKRMELRNVRQRSELIWALLLCLVLVNGFMAAPSVAHTGHHATHHAGVHGTGICAWLCAAGQAIESSSIDFDSVLQLVSRVGYVYIPQDTLPFSLFHFLRGPPIRSR